MGFDYKVSRSLDTTDISYPKAQRAKNQ